MQVELIEGMIANKLELSGMKNEGAEGQCRSLLYHLYTAVELYRLMVPAEKQIAKEWHDVFAKDFRVNQFLKELKSKKNKEKTAPAPHRKEKTIKENSQKTTHTTEGGASLLETRQKAFWDACLKFEPEYDRQLLLKFYCYWAEQVNGTAESAMVPRAKPAMLLPSWIAAVSVPAGSGILLMVYEILPSVPS